MKDRFVVSNIDPATRTESVTRHKIADDLVESGILSDDTMRDTWTN